MVKVYGNLLFKKQNKKKKNAMFLITIPNDFSELQKKTFKIVKKKYWLTYPEHLNYIDKKNFFHRREN